MSKCDVAFMPLSDNSFNSFKSDLKAIEAGSRGLAILSSSFLYGDNFINGETAAFFDTKEQLKNILIDWENSPSKIFQLGKNAQLYIANNRLLSHQVNERIGWYESLFERKEELTRKLYSRIQN